MMFARKLQSSHFKCSVVIVCAILPFFSLRALSLFPGISASYAQTTLTGESSQQAYKYAGYGTGVFALIGFNLGINRLYFGPVAELGGSFDEKINTSRVGGELRFDVLLRSPVVPFTRLQYGVDQLQSQNFDFSGAVFDVKARGHSFRWLAGILIPIRERIALSFEAGVQSGVLDTTDAKLVSGTALPGVLERRNLFALMFGVNVGYRFFE